MRFNPYKVDAVSYQHLVDLSKHHTASPLDNALLQLIDVRVSQINGCAFCLAMHTEGPEKPECRNNSSTWWLVGGTPRASPIASGPPWVWPRP